MKVSINGEYDFEATPVEPSVLEQAFDVLKPYDDGLRRTVEAYGNRIMHFVMGRTTNALMVQMLLDNYHQSGVDEEGQPLHEAGHIEIATLTHTYGIDEDFQELVVVRTPGIVPDVVINDVHQILPSMLRLTLQRQEYLDKLFGSKQGIPAHV